MALWGPQRSTCQKPMPQWRSVSSWSTVIAPPWVRPRCSCVLACVEHARTHAYALQLPRLAGGGEEFRMETYDVIVVGVGGMGSAAVYHLAQRGLRVLGIEQYDIPHDRGSSHGLSRIIRLAYFEHPAYVSLLHCAYELWWALERTVQERLLII